jgi:N6-adenosine-specific RNA methylase IME4
MNKRYDVIYADPAWRYQNNKTGGSHTSGASQQYATMSLDEICDMPVSSIAAQNSVCFLWATTPLGRDPYDVLDAWDYEFKTKWYWHKTGRKGIGYWTRNAVEEVLIGVRGKVTPWRSTLDNWIEAAEEVSPFQLAPEGHSIKPQRVRLQIEELTPEATRVELFAREKWWLGWDAYGLDIDPAHDFRDANFWRAVGSF